jgi:antitoxin (DNA-binding transcriptional repressor) of toxin-antitoxin stability system
MPIVREIEERDLAERVDEVFDEIDAGVEYIIVKEGRRVARLVRMSESEPDAE